jgi:hypothetical protein
MKKQTIQNWAISLQSLGIVFVLLLSTAFVCSNGSESTSGENSIVSTTNSAALTEAIVKEIITTKEKRVNDEVLKPEVTFESVRIGKTRKANKADEYEGIPAGETVYPVRVKYNVTLQYSTGPETKNHHYDWDFFKDEHGEWATLGKGPVRQ